METRQNGVRRFRKHYMVVQTKPSEHKAILFSGYWTKLLIEEYQQNLCVSAGGNHHG
jgi:hypothetical protein